MNTEMKMEKRKLSELRPADYNPRKLLTPEDKEYQDIKRSIEKFGYVDPIIINSDGTVIGGHQRINVLMDLGYDEADVVIVDLDKDNEKALNIALNKITGEWDEIKLKNLLLELDLNEYDLQNTGFSAGEIEDLCVRLEKEVEAEDDNFDLEEELEKIEDPITRRGDVWILGNHRLMCGDSTSPKDVAILLAGDEADLAMFDSMKPGAAAYIFHADSEGLAFRRAFRNAGFKLAECLIWEKNSFVLGRQDYQWRHEPILYGWKEGAAHYFIDDRTQDTGSL